MLKSRYVSIEVGIFGHHSRTKKIFETIRAFRAAGFDRIQTSVDMEGIGAFAMHCRALKACKQETTHFLLAQEDIRLCSHFKEALYNAVRAKPDAVISPHCSRKSMDQAALNKKAWMRDPGILYGQGYVIPIWKINIQEILNWYEKMMPGWESKWGAERIRRWDDYFITLYFRYIQQPMWFTVPSLLDHDDDFYPSLLGHNKPRKARIFVGEKDARDIDFENDYQDICQGLQVYDSPKAKFIGTFPLVKA